MEKAFSTYLAHKVLDHVTGTAAFTAPAKIYIGLSTADPGQDGSGMNEPSGGGYARVESGAFAAASSHQTSNESAIEFSESSGAWASGSPLTHFAAFDAATGGNILFRGDLATPRKVEAEGEKLLFKVGDLVVTLDKPA